MAQVTKFITDKNGKLLVDENGKPLALTFEVINGEDGREITLENNGEYIRWQYVGDSSWTNLVSIASLKGDKGDTPNISIGTVNTSESGGNASASITGSPENPVLNLTLPRGQKGDQGIEGKQGIQGQTGATGAGIQSMSINGLTITAQLTNGSTITAQIDTTQCEVAQAI